MDFTATQLIESHVELEERGFGGEFLPSFTEYFGFYDWFCRDESLKARSIALTKKLKFLVEVGLVPEDATVNYKNNCPLYGVLYDDIRISFKRDNKKYYFVIVPKQGYTINNCSLFWCDHKSIEFPKWSDLKKDIKENTQKYIDIVESNARNEA